MIIMFCVSVVGQVPNSLTGIIATYTEVNPLIGTILSVWLILSLLFNMIDLFLYNHEVRRYLAGFFFRCVRH